MMKKYRLILLIPFIFFGGCSNGDDATRVKKPNEEHLLKDQVRALEKAKEVGAVMQSAAEKQRRTIDEVGK